MIPLTAAVSSKLTWSKLPRNRGYEFRQNDSVVATLQQTGFWSCESLAKTQDGDFGAFRTGAGILEASSERQVAAFKAVWGGKGTLTFADGQTFYLVCNGWWRPAWSVTNEAGQPVVKLHAREKTIETPLGTQVNEGRLALITLFTLYRMQQAEEDAAAASMVAVIAATGIRLSAGESFQS
jgi:hypothetical protein